VTLESPTNHSRPRTLPRSLPPRIFALRSLHTPVFCVFVKTCAYSYPQMQFTSTLFDDIALSWIFKCYFNRLVLRVSLKHDGTDGTMKITCLPISSANWETGQSDVHDNENHQSDDWERWDTLNCRKMHKNDIYVIRIIANISNLYYTKNMK